jgi:hypothetical protein
VTLKLKVLLPPLLTLADKFTVLRPQVRLFGGFCDPSLHVAVVHAALPLFCMLTDTL